MAAAYPVYDPPIFQSPSPGPTRPASSIVGSVLYNLEDLAITGAEIDRVVNEGPTAQQRDTTSTVISAVFVTALVLALAFVVYKAAS